MSNSSEENFEIIHPKKTSKKVKRQQSVEAIKDENTRRNKKGKKKGKRSQSVKKKSRKNKSKTKNLSKT